MLSSLLAPAPAGSSVITERSGAPLTAADASQQSVGYSSNLGNHYGGGGANNTMFVPLGGSTATAVHSGTPATSSGNMGPPSAGKGLYMTTTSRPADAENLAAVGLQVVGSGNVTSKRRPSVNGLSGRRF
ncbi:unnamed protein product [Amoebophrya sp. A25]|nr:unnamed protein product [Amoebophrya sp. A25]|eukprot:GSA25T00024136001.1